MRTAPLVRFHLVSLYGLLALVGTSRLVSGYRSPPVTVADAGALVVAISAVIGSIVASYVLNKTSTWPADPSPAAGATITPDG